MQSFFTNVFLNLIFILQINEYSCQLKVFTPDNQAYAEPLSNFDIDITHITNLKFSVKACADTHVIIQKNPTVDFYTGGNFVFVIGSSGGLNVQIKDYLHGNVIQTKSPGSVLDCTVGKPFWISWKDGDLKIGKGTVLFADEIVASSVGSLNGYKYAFLLTGWGSDGCWTIDIGNNVISHRIKLTSNNKMIQGNGIQTYTVESRLGCFERCVSDELSCGCKLYSYNTATRQCLVAGPDLPVTQIVNADWQTWQV